MLSSCKTAAVEISRRTANFHPTIWGDFFLTYSSDRTEIDSEKKAKHERLREEVRSMLLEIPDQDYPKLDLIDAVQRLGVAYHFNNEIEESLRNVYKNFEEESEHIGEDLHVVALRFRLLRQQGYRVSPEIFRKFKDHDGNFKGYLNSNLRGLVSLYEASEFRVQGEDILEEAQKFTTSQLELLIETVIDAKEAEVLTQSLKAPTQKSLTRPAGRLYIPSYERLESHNELLLKFAKLDFNILQKLHQKELGELTKWWKRLDFQTNFPYARNRFVELYFWVLGIYFEPKYRLARKYLLKMITLSSIIDDTYDAYGTMDELTLFTDAIDRMNVEAMDGLPSYMRHCYQALLDLYSEMEEELGKQGKEDLVSYVKADTQKLVRSYYQEAKWFNDGYIPRFDEYLENALISCGYMLLATTSLIGMEELAMEETLHWVSNEPLNVRAACMICRLMSDVVGHQFEQQRGHVASGIECYMNQYGASENEALMELGKRVVDAWKDINSECLQPTVVPMAVLQIVSNFARVIHLLYRDKDCYTHSSMELKELVTIVLVDPVAI